MSEFTLSDASRKKLAGVHPDLVRVVEHAITLSDIDFRVAEGRRTRERQAALFKAGATKTMNSRHLTGHAVDLVAMLDGGVRWDWPLYPKIAAAMKRAAADLRVPIVWGGDWSTFRDGPHFELDRRRYP